MHAGEGEVFDAGTAEGFIGKKKDGFNVVDAKQIQPDWIELIVEIDDVTPGSIVDRMLRRRPEQFSVIQE